MNCSKRQIPAFLMGAGCMLLLASTVVCHGKTHTSSSPPKMDGTSLLMPMEKITIKNKGGFVLRTRHFTYRDDKSCCKETTKNLLRGEKSTFMVPQYSEVYLHAIAAGGWSKCVRVESGGGTVICSRASLNMHCYFTDNQYGYIHGINGGGCHFGVLQFNSGDSGKNNIQNITLETGKNGDIQIYNAGATTIRSLKVYFFNPKGKPDTAFAGFFDNEKSNCVNNRLKAGHFCNLHYIIPPTFKPRIGAYAIYAAAKNAIISAEISVRINISNHKKL